MAILGPLLPAVKATVPPDVVPFAIGLVVTPRRLVAVALGPLIAPGSHFLELLVIVQAWSFTTLRLPKAIRRVLSPLGLPVGEIVLVEQSRPEDIILGVDDSAFLSGRWRAFALSHHLLIGDSLVFCFKIGALEASVRVFNADGIRRTYPLPAAME
jgi:hypothetical protein